MQATAVSYISFKGSILIECLRYEATYREFYHRVGPVPVFPLYSLVPVISCNPGGISVNICRIRSPGD